MKVPGWLIFIILAGVVWVQVIIHARKRDRQNKHKDTDHE